MRGRWAAGIVPRNFCWIVKDHLAVSERPGGYAPNHRKVRRQEELLWLRAQGFTRVVSLLGSTHNLHAYGELGLEWNRFPMPLASETPRVLAELYPSLQRWLRSGERVLLHQEELGDCVMGVVAGYLLWSEILPDGPRAITAMEQLLRRQMGTVGRMIVAAVEEVPPPGYFASLASQGGLVAEPQADATGEQADVMGELVTSVPGEDGGEADSVVEVGPDSQGASGDQPQAETGPGPVVTGAGDDTAPEPEAAAEPLDAESAPAADAESAPAADAESPPATDAESVPAAADAEAAETSEPVPTPDEGDGLAAESS